MANDFSGDSDAKGVFNFESGARTVDSSGNSNTLTEVNTPTSDTTNYKQGSASITYTENNTERSYRTDANLSAGFPLKSSGGATSFSLTAWVRLTDDDDSAYMFNKYHLTSNRTFGLLVNNDSGDPGDKYFYTVHGYNSGDSYANAIVVDESAVIGRWYFLHFTYNAATRQHRLRVWDDTAGDWWTNSPFTNTPANAMSIGTADWAIGCRSDGSTTKAFDGNMDELVFWSRVLSDADADLVKAGTFGAGTNQESIAGTATFAGALAAKLSAKRSIAGVL